MGERQHCGSASWSGPPHRTGALRGVICSCDQHAAVAVGACYAVPPAATAQHVPGRVLVATQRGAAHPAPVDPLRERLRNTDLRARAVLRRAGRGNFDEGNAGACSEAMEFLPSRLRLAFVCPLKRRLLLAAVLRTSPAARHRALLSADCASHRRLPLALQMSAVGRGGKAPDARIQPHRAFRHVRPDCRQLLFEQELNLDPPRLANDAEARSRSSGGSGRRITNCMRGRPFLRNSPRRPSSRIRSALRADFGSSTRNGR